MKHIECARKSASANAFKSLSVWLRKTFNLFVPFQSFYSRVGNPQKAWKSQLKKSQSPTQRGKVGNEWSTI